MCFPPLKWTFDVFDIHLIKPKNQKFSIDQFYCQLTYVGYHLKGIQIVILFNPFVDNIPLGFS